MKKILLILLVFSSTTTFGQWEEFFTAEGKQIHFAELNPNGKLLLGLNQNDVYYQIERNTFGLYDLDGLGYLSAMAFQNSEVGFMGGGCFYTFDQCLANTLYKTTDGGETWNLMHQYGSFGIFNSISILDNGEIFALSEYEELIHSTDGGQTWTVITINPDDEFFQQQGLQFVNSQVGYLSGQAYMSGVYRTLFKTTDGGQTWTMIYGSAEETKGVQEYYFFDEYTGFATHRNGQIARTTDGGYTWTKINFSTNTDEFAMRIYFPTANIGYLTTGETGNGNFQKGRLYRTEDGGLTWTLEFQYDNGFLNDIDFLDAENGYLIAGSQKVYKRSGTVETSDTPLDLAIFPNPAKDYFNINVMNLPTGEYQLNVLNVLGQIVITTDNLYHPVNIQKLAAATYIVEIRNEEQELIGRTKLVK